MYERFDNGYLKAPAGADLTFPEEQIVWRKILIDPEFETVNTCNPAIGDIDGDGLDEIALPFNMGETDVLRLYRGDGTIIWECRNEPGGNDAGKNSALFEMRFNTGKSWPEERRIRFYHSYYNDPLCPPQDLSHLWYRNNHRHLLTEICDVDGDGKKEVVVGDGPIYIIDGMTGTVKRIIELGGMCPLWNCIYDPLRKRTVIAVTQYTFRNTEKARVLLIDGMTGAVLWEKEMPGGQFADCMHNGDLNGDGRPVFGFSISSPVEKFYCMDLDGNILWEKSVRQDLGDDAHVDNFVIDRILPESDPVSGKQLALVCGPNIFDSKGNLIWKKIEDEDLFHSQHIMTGSFIPDIPGKQIYVCESFVRRSHLFDCRGNKLWTYDNYTCHSDGKACERLTTAACVCDWYGNGTPYIFQTEMSFRKELWPAIASLPPDKRLRFAHLLSGSGEAVKIFPITCCPMCAIACKVTESPGDDIVIIGHHDSTIHIYSSK